MRIRQLRIPFLVKLETYHQLADSRFMQEVLKVAIWHEFHNETAGHQAILTAAQHANDVLVRLHIFHDVDLGVEKLELSRGCLGCTQQITMKCSSEAYYEDV